MLDIATHVAASAGLDTPDYAAALDRRGELGVLPADFAKRLWALARFRNVLVHGYLEVDLEEVGASSEIGWTIRDVRGTGRRVPRGPLTGRG